MKFFTFIADNLNIRFPLKWEDQKEHATTQDYADMLGWDELAEKVSKAYHQIPANERATATIFASNYGQAGAIDHYRKKYNLPPVVCLNSSYALWAPHSIPSNHFVYVNDEYPDDLLPYFKTMRKIGEVENPYAREKGTAIFLLSYPEKDLMPLYQADRNKKLE